MHGSISELFIVPLIYMSLLTLIPHLITELEYTLKLSGMSPPTFIIKDYLGYFRCFSFHINFITFTVFYWPT